MSRFVDIEASDEITLANGDKVTVRQRLTAPEDAELVRRLMRMRIDAKTGAVQAEEGDWHLQRVHICEAYLLGWDFRDDEGKVMGFERALIRQLDQDTVVEIATAIDALQAARREAAEKKG